MLIISETDKSQRERERERVTHTKDNERGSITFIDLLLLASVLRLQRV